LAIPFGAIGIIISFYFHDMFWKSMPLSFFSSLGMVALTGVVVNSSLVLLVFIQRARQEGMDVIDAIVTAGRRRLRAVLLTAATTVVGLLPTAYGWGGLDPFVSPMALALSWGLVFATGVTLITIPATLAVAHDIRLFFIKLCSTRKVIKFFIGAVAVNSILGFSISLYMIVNDNLIGNPGDWSNILLAILGGYAVKEILTDEYRSKVIIVIFYMLQIIQLAIPSWTAFPHSGIYMGIYLPILDGVIGINLVAIAMSVLSICFMKAHKYIDCHIEKLK